MAMDHTYTPKTAVLDSNKWCHMTMVPQVFGMTLIVSEPMVQWHLLITGGHGANMMVLEQEVDGPVSVLASDEFIQDDSIHQSIVKTWIDAIPLETQNKVVRQLSEWGWTDEDLRDWGIL